MLTIQEPVHQSFVSVRRQIVDKSADFLRVGRQTDQVHIGSAKQCEPIGLRRRLQTFVLAGFFQKAVNGIRQLQRNGGNRRLGRQLEGPVFAGAGRKLDLFQIRERRRVGLSLCCDDVGIPMSALIAVPKVT